MWRSLDGLGTWLLPADLNCTTTNFVNAGILIAADHVKIDLNGHMINGNFKTNMELRPWAPMVSARAQRRPTFTAAGSRGSSLGAFSASPRTEMEAHVGRINVTLNGWGIQLQNSDQNRIVRNSLSLRSL
jgi:hypothetical protein